MVHQARMRRRLLKSNWRNLVKSFQERNLISNCHCCEEERRGNPVVMYIRHALLWDCFVPRNCKGYVIRGQIADYYLLFKVIISIGFLPLIP